MSILGTSGDPDSSSISDALKAAQATEFVAPAPDSPSDVDVNAAPASTEPAGDIAPPAEETATASEPEGEPVAEPTEPAGTPPGEVQASDTDEDMAVALRVAGNDPAKIPAKLREFADKFSKTNNELLTAQKRIAELEAAKATPATPQVPAPANTSAPAQPAATVSAEPDPKVIENEVSQLLGQDAEYTRAAQGHWTNLTTLVAIDGGTDTNGNRVQGRLAEIDRDIAAKELYLPENMAKHGFQLDEFAISQLNVPQLRQNLWELKAERATLAAQSQTLRMQNMQFESRINARYDAATKHVTSRYTQTARETEAATARDTEATTIADAFNRDLAELTTQLGVTDDDARETASIRAQHHFRKNPDDAFDPQKRRSVIETEVKREAAKLDKVKRDAVREKAVRKDQISKPMAPAGAAAVAASKTSPTADPFSDLKNADRARYRQGQV